MRWALGGSIRWALLRQREPQGCRPAAAKTNTPGTPGLPQSPRQRPHRGDERVRALHTQLCLCGSGTQQVPGRRWEPPTTANDQPQGDFFPPLGSGVNCQPCF